MITIRFKLNTAPPLPPPYIYKKESDTKSGFSVPKALPHLRLGGVAGVKEVKSHSQTS